MLINPRLKGFSLWQQGNDSGIIYIYFSDNAEGDIVESSEGNLEWKSKNEIKELKQFGMNRILNEYILSSDDCIFEGKFLLDDDAEVIDFSIRMI